MKPSVTSPGIHSNGFDRSFHHSLAPHIALATKTIISTYALMPNANKSLAHSLGGGAEKPDVEVDFEDMVVTQETGLVSSENILKKFLRRIANKWK